MATAEATLEEAPKKRSKKPLLIGLVLALVLGGGGFYATFSGLILGGGEDHASEEAAPGPLLGVAFADAPRAIGPLDVRYGRTCTYSVLRARKMLARASATNERVAFLAKPR